MSDEQMINLLQLGMEPRVVDMHQPLMPDHDQVIDARNNAALDASAEYQDRGDE